MAVRELYALENLSHIDWFATLVRLLRESEAKLELFLLGTAILFNPIILFPLGREIWSLVDIVVLPPLFISLVTLKRYFPLSGAQKQT